MFVKMQSFIPGRNKIPISELAESFLSLQTNDLKSFNVVDYDFKGSVTLLNIYKKIINLDALKCYPKRAVILI